VFNSPDGGVPLGPSPQNFTWMLTDGQRTKWRRNIAENVIAWVGCTNVTDDRQTYGQRHIANVKASSRLLQIVIFNYLVNVHTYEMITKVKVVFKFIQGIRQKYMKTMRTSAVIPVYFCGLYARRNSTPRLRQSSHFFLHMWQLVR